MNCGPLGAPIRYPVSRSDPGATHVMPNAFIAAVIGSEKNTGSTRTTMSPETSRKFLLFSSGIRPAEYRHGYRACTGQHDSATNVVDRLVG
jgi:hypothetical protein